MIATAIKRLVQRPKAEAPAVGYLVPMSHLGHNGYAVFENGNRVAWGASVSAATAAYEQHLAAKKNR